MLRLTYAAALLTIWAGYRFSVGPLIAPAAVGEAAAPAGASAPPPALDRLARAPVFPAPALFEGLGELAAKNRAGHKSYLLGEVRTTGWWYFFPVALAVKTPLPFLLLVAAGPRRLVARFLRRRSTQAARAGRHRLCHPAGLPAEPDQYRPAARAANVSVPRRRGRAGRRRALARAARRPRRPGAGGPAGRLAGRRLGQDASRLSRVLQRAGRTPSRADSRGQRSGRRPGSQAPGRHLAGPTRPGSVAGVRRVPPRWPSTACRRFTGSSRTSRSPAGWP